MRFRDSLIVAVLGCCVASALNPALNPGPEQAKETQLPEGPGRETVKVICGKCHPIETVVASRRTRTGWERMTDEMVTRGAKGTDEQLDAVVDYLTAHFGKVNVNTASVADLQEALGFTEKEAKLIVAYREQVGKFKTFEELQKVQGVSEERLKEK